jgi:DNA helicase IV
MMSKVVKSPSELIDQLIHHWEYWDEFEQFYVQEMAPDLVKNPNRRDADEKEIFEKLGQVLSQEEFAAIPKLIAERRRGKTLAVKVEQEQLEKEKARKRRKEKRKKHIENIRKMLETDFFGADAYYYGTCCADISPSEYEAEKHSFVRSWMEAHISMGKNGRTIVPDEEQIAAIAAVNGNIQVVARAGSGKTSTLVNRAYFLMKHCGVDPNEILLLAFNRKATSEIRKRLLLLLSSDSQSPKEQISALSDIDDDSVDRLAAQLGIKLPHVMTFHALAHAIVHPEESLLYNSVREEIQDLNRAFQLIIDEFLRDATYGSKIRTLMMAHFREDWGRIVEGRYPASRDDFLEFRRSLPREALRGERVKSFGEKRIADFLFEHDIPYQYERNHWWGNSNYRPDFTLPRGNNSGIIVEYFGIEGDPDNDEMSDAKRAYWGRKSNWSLIELYPADIVRKEGEQAFCEKFRGDLHGYGVQCERLSEDEIWRRIRERAIDRFTMAMSQFILRCRKERLSPGDLVCRIQQHKPLSDVENIFLGLAQLIFAAYLERLSETGEEDFDGLLQRAIREVESGNLLFSRRSGSGDVRNLRHISIDEFQDFSLLFSDLIGAIRNRNHTAQLFCVGDDWQAINRFAGSRLKYFEDFTSDIDKSDRLYISTNHRSSANVISASNELMNGMGNRAKAGKDTKGNVLVVDLAEFIPTTIERERHKYDIITPVVIRIAAKAVSEGKQIVILCRRNTLPWYVNNEDEKADGRMLDQFRRHISSFFPEELRGMISTSTVHQYKGKERAVVIIADAVEGSFPLIHHNWPFFRIFGDTPDTLVDEERRLFYVAMTRAIDELIILTEHDRKSPFLEEVEARKTLGALDWYDYPALDDPDKSIVVRVGNQEGRGSNPTYEIKDNLKASGFSWERTGWARSFIANGFDVETLKNQAWAKDAGGIEVRIQSSSGSSKERYLIDDGEWKRATVRSDSPKSVLMKRKRS